MIEMDDVYFSYGKKPVLNGVSLSVHNGDFVGLIGNNGAGKTTLLKVMLHLLKPLSGTVHDDFRRSSFLTQVTNTSDLVFPATVKEVVSLGLKNRPFSFMTRKDWAKVDAALDQMGVRDLANRAISELSGGQQQRVRLAKALVNQPDLLIMDEPTTGMDICSRKSFFDEVEKLREKHGMTVVLVSHFYEDLALATRIYLLKEDGKVYPETLDFKKGDPEHHD